MHPQPLEESAKQRALPMRFWWDRELLQLCHLSYLASSCLHDDTGTARDRPSCVLTLEQPGTDHPTCLHWDSQGLGVLRADTGTARDQVSCMMTLEQLGTGHPACRHWKARDRVSCMMTLGQPETGHPACRHWKARDQVSCMLRLGQQGLGQKHTISDAWGR